MRIPFKRISQEFLHDSKGFLENVEKIDFNVPEGQGIEPYTFLTSQELPD